MLDETMHDFGAAFGGLLKAAGLGLWQLRKPSNLLLFLGSAAIGGLAVILLPMPLWVVPLPPLVTVLTLGVIRKSEIAFYCKAFTDVGFKGRDGKTPYLISKCNLGNNRTGYYFKSNISLGQWKKSMSALQTALDCTILSVKQGKSQKIVHVVSIPADIELGEMLPWDDKLMSEKSSVVILGESISGIVKFDFNNTPHWILAGSTGSGKSVLMRSIVYQSLVKGHKVYLMDFKRGVEFGKAYDDFCEVIMDKKRAVAVLEELVKENRRRLDELRRCGVKNLDEYNAANKNAPLERIVVFIDETAIMLIPTKERGDKELTAQATDYLENIAILGRAAAINIVLGIQRPDANTVTGQIKSNVSGRVCGYFADPAPSLIVLNNTRANDIDSDAKGRFMFQDGKETIEFQGYYQKEKQVISGIIDSRTAMYRPKGIKPEIPVKPSKEATKETKKKWLKLNFDYDNLEDTK